VPAGPGNDLTGEESTRKVKFKMNKKFSGKRVLITGGLGMIGSTVARQLVKYNARVTIVDACLKPYGANKFNIRDIRSRVDLHIKDIRDKKAMDLLVREKDIIFNFAAQVSHNDSIGNPFLDADINYIGHLNILESLRRCNPTARVLFSGSRLQFGRIKTIPVNESHILRPLTPYALNKTAAEYLYKYYYRMYGIPYVIFRIANPYGPRAQMKHSKYTILNYFIRQAMEGRDITVYGTGEQIRDYIYIDDLVSAFLSAAVSQEAEAETFNIGSGVGTSFKDMVGAVVKTVGRGQLKFIPWPNNYINVETGDYVTDISKAKKILKWRPCVGIRKGVGETYEYYKKYKRHYF